MKRASLGCFLVAIGPAGDALAGGSEGRTGQTRTSQLLDGAGWAVNENSNPPGAYFGNIDTTKAALVGQSCGTGQALQDSGSPGVTTTVLLIGGPGLGACRAPDRQTGRRGQRANPRRRPRLPHTPRPVTVEVMVIR